MIDERKNSLKYNAAWILSVLLSITIITSANYSTGHKIQQSLTVLQETAPGIAFNGVIILADTIPPLKDSIIIKDSLTVKTGVANAVSDTVPLLKDSAAIKDSLSMQTDTVNLNLSKDSIDAPIVYQAADSVLFIVPEKKIILFSEANIKQSDMELSADNIEIDQSTDLVTAAYRRDSTGKMIGRPKMVQAETTMESDEIVYNTKTQKGITRQTVTQQGEIFVQGEKVKKISPSEFFAFRGQFTTCNLDTPHFAFRTKKMKLINQKLAVSGPIHPEFEGVPVPIYLPFGLFPISQGRKSGFLPPQVATNEQFGLGLQGLGYYKVLGDNFDVLLRGDVYSYGGWAAYFEPTYRKRYRYNGRMLFTLQHTRMISSDPKVDFTNSRTFNINWSHTVDAKARPGQSFSANVNAGSTKFNQYVLNNPMRNYNNSLNSSVTYSKTWDGKYNLSLSANHSQNNNLGLVSLTLPNLAFTANTLYPLQKKDFAGTPKWYQKLGIGLNSQVSNRIDFYDSLFSFRNIVDTLQWGAQHSIPIQLSLPSLGPLQVSPGINYQEKWYSRQFIRTYNPVTEKVDTSINKGFFTARDISFSLGLSTALFGKLDKFGKNSRVQAIRHTVRPSVSLSYKPDLARKDYDSLMLKNGYMTRVSRYEGSIFGAFSEGTYGGLSFGIDNNLEMKVKSKKDTGDAAIKKVRLLDGFGFNSGYNFIADSFKLAPFNLYVRSTLFEKVNITAGATLDPYQVDSLGFKRNKYAWQGGAFTPGRITSGNIAISTSFKSKPKDDKKDAATSNDALNDVTTPMTMEEQMSQLEYVRNNPAEFADFNIPWSVNLSYSLSFFRQFKRDYSGFETTVNSNLSVNGDFNLTPKWKMGLNTYYDFKSSSIQMLTMFISREMHCWQLSINVTPVGYYRSFNITVNPKSGILRDLRINRTRSFFGN
ncbi:MAG: LPS-assembly protein LptD [Chitinophagaceae bacterium]|nr:LPS-assembly protein LptD [Chitinophagaceae bacterium]